ncbi:MAG: M23 family metallopeptidase [Acidimicrobiia bacterium]
MNPIIGQRLQFGLVALVVGLVVGAMPALAHDEPEVDLSFKTRFPQEIDETYFSSSFGDPRPGGRRHQGNDLMAPKMTEVYAFADGVVAVIDEAWRPGRFVIIEHEEGWETYYIHLNDDNPGTDDGRADWSFTIAPGIEEGVQVKAGQLIAWVGDSGNAEGSGSHTHFELRHHNRSVDPYPYLKAAREHELARSERIPMDAQIF